MAEEPWVKVFYRYFGLLLLAVFAVLLVWAAVLAISEARFRAGASHATGIIVDVEVHVTEKPGEPPTYTDVPVVEYTPAGGSEVRFTNKVGDGDDRARIDSTVDVLYDPGNPSDARIDDLHNKVARPLAFAGVGLIFAISALLSLRAAARRRPTRTRT
jgi:uncharacterized protein DUF3592